MFPVYRFLLYPFVDAFCGGWPAIRGRAEYYLLPLTVLALYLGYENGYASIVMEAWLMLAFLVFRVPTQKKSGAVAPRRWQYRSAFLRHAFGMTLSAWAYFVAHVGLLSSFAVGVVFVGVSFGLAVHYGRKRDDYEARNLNLDGYDRNLQFIRGAAWAALSILAQYKGNM